MVRLNRVFYTAHIKIKRLAIKMILNRREKLNWFDKTKFKFAIKFKSEEKYYLFYIDIHEYIYNGTFKKKQLVNSNRLIEC